MNENDDMKHMNYLRAVANSDIESLQHKEKTYQGSWKKRGGCGAFFMLARKWDRIENILNRAEYRWDIFAVMDTESDHEGDEGEDGTLLAEIRDLRRYLMLVEAEMMARGVVSAKESDTYRPGTPEDGGHHYRDQYPEEVQRQIDEVIIRAREQQKGVHAAPIINTDRLVPRS
jgi:hypothetical protein